MKYLIRAVRIDENNRVVKTEHYRDDFPHALLTRDYLRDLGWLASIYPTPEVWTEELSV